MRKSLHLLAAAALLSALGACNRSATPDEEQRALNEAAAMTEDNAVFDTSPDDMSVNAEDVAAEENVTEAAPANASDNRTANQQ